MPISQESRKLSEKLVKGHHQAVGSQIQTVGNSTGQTSISSNETQREKETEGQ